MLLHRKIMKKLHSIWICLFIIVLTGSCVSHKKMVYLQDIDNKKAELKEFQVARTVTDKIQPGDELYINVTSSDERPTNFSVITDYATDVTLRSYTVDNEGFIRFPYLGQVNVLGKSIEEISDEIEKALGDYLLTPAVIVKFVNKNITVLGEVGSPGVYNFYDKNINLLQAIAYAGDITAFGNRRRIVLLREENGTITKNRIDLTDENLLLSDLYVIRSDDIIYIEPLKIKRWGFEEFPYTLVFTIINTSLILWTFALSLY